MTTNVLAFLERSALRFPDRTAVIEGDRRITFSALLHNAKAVGSALLGKTACGAPVGVYMEKGIDALCAFFGTVYAGGCYAMLNTEFPEARLRSIREVLGTDTVITSAALADKARQVFAGARVYNVEELLRTQPDEAGLKAVRDRAVDVDPLYINFTSGSTGVPKGIAVSHRSVIDFMNCFPELFSITENDVIANQAPFDFDVSVKDIFSALKTGATLLIVPRELFSAPVKLMDCLCENRVTTMIWAVSALCLISTFHALDYRTPETVNKILFSGEVMPHKHLLEWLRHLPDAVYVNLYGPTEITCNCTYHVLEKGRDYAGGIPIGRPFPNEDVFLLSGDNERITAPGITGGITVRGTALALGYYRLPEKTAESFTPNPLNGAYPETVYRTGDLGYYNENGELMYAGRADNQIKYMGHRIELEEIERAMGALEGVERCVCVFDGKKEKLRGYYVGNVDKTTLTARMRETMPSFMIPGSLRQVPSLPLNKNGKVDRKALSQMIGGKSDDRHTG